MSANSFLDTTNDGRSSEQSAIPNRILFGRFMLPDMSEHPCQVGEIDADGVTLLTNFQVDQGTHIIAYLDDIGRVDGTMLRQEAEGFRVAFNLKGDRRERMRKRLDWLFNSDPEQRRHTRVVPKQADSVMVLTDGREYPCEVLDISVSGAALKTPVVPSIGTVVNLGRMRGRVVRYTDDGIAIEFKSQIDPEKFSEQLAG